MGIHIPEDRLDASTLLGLRALRAAEADFARAYPQCGGCSHRNRRGAMTCRGCGSTFETRKAG